MTGQSASVGGIIGGYVDDPISGFSLMHEVLHGTLCDQLQDSGAVVYLKPQERTTISGLLCDHSQKISDLTIMQKILSDRFPMESDGSNSGVIQKLCQLKAARDRDRRADGD